MPTSVLVVDDDPAILDIVEDSLVQEGFIVRVASTSDAALKALALALPDIVILDVMMEHRNSGHQLCRSIRADYDLPVIFLTARVEEIDAIVGLELGADDYIKKPFSPRELAARIRTVLRRTSSSPGSDPDPEGKRWSIGEFLIDEGRLSLATPHGERSLSRTEFLMLRTLASNLGAVFSREQIIDDVYGDASTASPRTVDSHIRKLRAKMNEIGSDPIETVRGVGYKLSQDLSSEA